MKPFLAFWLPSSTALGVASLNIEVALKIALLILFAAFLWKWQHHKK
jgi:hypothetical protein